MRRILQRVAIASFVAITAILLWFRSVEAPKATGKVATVPVVVAARDVPEGVILDRMALVVAQWPSGTAPAGAYNAVDSIVGRVPRVPIYKGEALVPGRLAPEGTGAGLEAKITPGKRAMPVRINDVTGIAGLVQPNSRVDILVVIEAEAKRVAKLFMENMRVLAIRSVPERTSEGRPINAAVATIEVTPEEAERLAIAMSQGEIQLVLRGYGDPPSIARPPTSHAPNAVPVLPGAPVPNAAPQPRYGRMPVYGPGMRLDTALMQLRSRTPRKFQADSGKPKPEPD